MRLLIVVASLPFHAARRLLSGADRALLFVQRSLEP